MFHETRPADLNAQGGADRLAEFRVDHPQERLRLLRELREGSVPVLLSGPEGGSYSTVLWSIDETAQRLSFSAEVGSGILERLIEQDEAVAVAYLESVKLQFDLHGLLLVRGLQASTLQCQLPAEIYRFQRRNAFRVRVSGRHEPVARLRHPSIPDLQLALRVLDVSIGGCALWLPADVPPLQPGTPLGDLSVELDLSNRFTSPARLLHLGTAADPSRADRGCRMGCQWTPLSGAAERVLQRWIDQAQKRRRLLSL